MKRMYQKLAGMLFLLICASWMSAAPDTKFSVEELEKAANHPLQLKPQKGLDLEVLKNAAIGCLGNGKYVLKLEFDLPVADLNLSNIAFYCNSDKNYETGRKDTKNVANNGLDFMLTAYNRANKPRLLNWNDNGKSSRGKVPQNVIDGKTIYTIFEPLVKPDLNVEKIVNSKSKGISQLVILSEDRHRAIYFFYL